MTLSAMSLVDDVVDVKHVEDNAPRFLVLQNFFEMVDMLVGGPGNGGHVGGKMNAGGEKPPDKFFYIFQS